MVNKVPANIETMFTVREKPWHGLGEVLEDTPNSAEALRASGLDWTVQQHRISVMSDSNSEARLIEGYVGNVRSSDGSVLGIVTDRYKVVQNHEAFAFTDLLVGDGDVRYETAGSLKGGRQVWMLARMNRSMSLLGDAFEPYLCFINSHDGTGAVRVLMTPIRVVCQNTLNIALRGARRSWSTPHVGDIAQRLAVAQSTLELADRYIVRLEEEADHLAQQPVSADRFEEILESLLPLESGSSPRAKASVLAQREGIVRAYGADDLERFRGTAWGVLNAVSDYVGHTTPRRQSATYKSNRWAKLAAGDSLFDDAYELLTIGG
jgi:phage/plasmid-like protein (TIGR03299 family)